MEETAEWRPGPPLPTVCRCCLAEGCYKDISTEYFWNGRTEVYSEMLSSTFDINISYSQSGGPNSNSRLICEACIARLRDATEFKKQVVECEKTFMQHLDPGRSTTVELEITPELGEKDVKLERVKEERGLDAYDDIADFADADDDLDDEDDLDDQPLTKLASKLPKKETVDILDLIDNKAATKRKATIKLKASPSKKSKTKEKAKPKEAAKASASKEVVKREKKKKAPVSRLAVAKRNAEVVLRFSTIYPFRLSRKSLLCVYCGDEFEDPKGLRQHIDDNHQIFNVSTAFAHCGKTGKEMLKVDCTDLKCRLCNEPFDTVNDMATHLYEVHDKNHINLEYEIGMQPYKLENDKWVCVICNEKLPSLTKLCRHTTSHYNSHTCDICGRSYLTVRALRYHIKCGHSDRLSCRKCWKTFSTVEKKKEHLKTSKQCWTFCCVYCGERFTCWEIKERHLVQVHNKPVRKYNCPDCPAVFEVRKNFYTHYKVMHTDEGFACPHCGAKFANKKRLQDHVLAHTGQKTYPCLICLKSFSREKSLKQHLWIHSENKRFVCKICDKTFAQKVSLKGHMKSYHPDVEFEN